MPTISVILVNYNTRDMTLRCLEVLLAELDGIKADIFVVDNASVDGSAEAVAAAFDSVRVIRNSRNLGFGAANNRAMLAGTGHVLLLNTDAFVKAGAVVTMLDCLETHPRCGVIGPRLLNEDGSLQRSCYEFPSPGLAWRENTGWNRVLRRLGFNLSFERNLECWEHRAVRTVPWVSGACMLVRREVLEQVGGFDERFFMYQEETDLQKRIRDAGWDVMFTPHAEVTHLGGGSGAAGRGAVNPQFFQSLDLYVRKHHGLTGLILVRLAMAVGCGTRCLTWAAVTSASMLTGRRQAVRHAVAKTSFNYRLFIRQAFNWRRPSVRPAA